MDGLRSSHDDFVREIIALAAAAACVSCNGPTQLLVVVDTDAPLGAQVLPSDSHSPDAAADTADALSADAAVDTVRVDLYGDDWGSSSSEGAGYAATFFLPDPSDWPFSFGAPSPGSDGAALRLRLRLFRGARAARVPRNVVAIDGRYVRSAPPVEATIDRLVEIPYPSDGESVARVLLSADCLGMPAAVPQPPGDEARTCTGGSPGDASEPPSARIQIGSDPGPTTTRAGKWPPAIASPCGPAPQADAICIQGGFSFMGETGLEDVEPSFVRAEPPRPVHVSAFWMDRTEFTVGRLRDLVNRGALKVNDDDIHPWEEGANCTWLGAERGDNDDMPVNCVSFRLASEACDEVRGALPTEAQWEHAARGRGEGRIYPWGDVLKENCRTVSAYRGGRCPGVGPEKVGSHQGSPGDVSRDGVLDLGGSVAELCADWLVPYGEGCWKGPGIFVDPRCDDASAGRHAARGGDWSGRRMNTRTTFRRGEAKDPRFGFRCVYEGGAP